MSCLGSQTFNESAPWTISEVSNHCVLAFERLRIQQEMDLFCDVILSVHGYEFGAHRCVLASCSPWFNSHLGQTDGSASGKEVVNIRFCNSYEAFRQFLTYIYSGRIIIDAFNVSQLLHLSHYFGINKLMLYCSEYLERNLKFDNCLSVLEMAEQFMLNDLLKISLGFIQRNFDKIYDSFEFLSLPLPKLQRILNEITWNISQDLLIRCIANWINFDIHNREENFITLLSFVNWNNIDTNFLTEHLEKDQLYSRSPEALFSILHIVERNIFLGPKLGGIYKSLQERMLPPVTQDFDHELEDNSSFLSIAINAVVKDLEHSEVDPDWFLTNVVAPPTKDLAAINNDSNKNISTEPIQERVASPNSTLASSQTMAQVARPRQDFDFSVETEYQMVEQVINEQRLSEERCKSSIKRYDPKFRALSEVFREAAEESSLKHEGNSVVPKSDGKLYDWLSEPSSGEIEGVTDCGQEEVVTDNSASADERNTETEDVSLSTPSKTNQIINELSDCQNLTVLKEPAEENKVILRHVTKKAKLLAADVSFQPNKSLLFLPSVIDSTTIDGTVVGDSAVDGTGVDGTDIDDTAVKCITIKKMKKYPCPLCDESTFLAKKRNYLMSHLRLKHAAKSEGPPFSCRLCSSKFNRLHSLLRHLFVHRTDGHFPCSHPGCNFTSKSQTYRDLHSVAIHERKFECTDCQAPNKTPLTFSSLRNLTDHKRNLHGKDCDTEIRRYTCPDCPNFKTKSASYLETHRRVKHNLVGVMTCPIDPTGCNFRTAKSSILKAHVAAHRNERNFKCNICTKSFIENSALKRHINTHSAEKLFCCDECDFRTKRLDKLKEHRLKRHSDKCSKK